MKEGRNMENKLVKAMALNDHIRIYCVNTTNLCNKERMVHDLWPTSLATLGRVSSVASIMAAMLKNKDERIVVQINGGGPIGTVMVEANENGHIRGFVGDPHIYLKYNESNKLAVGIAVGTEGYLKVTKDSNLKNNFTGQVALQSGEIGDDFAYYFTTSEQTPSVVSCGVLVDTDYSCKSAGALIIQLLPDANEEDIVTVEEVLKTLKPISTLIQEQEEPSLIIKSIFKDATIVETKEVTWSCDCQKERFKMGLLTLNINDLKEMAQDEDEIEVKCEYCNKTYTFDKKELNEMVEFKAQCGK